MHPNVVTQSTQQHKSRHKITSQTQIQNIPRNQSIPTKTTNQPKVVNINLNQARKITTNQTQLTTQTQTQTQPFVTTKQVKPKNLNPSISPQANQSTPTSPAQTNHNS